MRIHRRRRIGTCKSATGRHGDWCPIGAFSKSQLGRPLAKVKWQTTATWPGRRLLGSGSGTPELLTEQLPTDKDRNRAVNQHLRGHAAEKEPPKSTALTIPYL